MVLRQIWKVANLLSLGVSMLSLTILAVKGFNLSINDSLADILKYYNELLDLLFGWADKPLANLMRNIENWIGVKLQVFTEWKHVFVLIWLYFSTDSRSSFLQKRTITGTVSLGFGLLVSISAIVACGGIFVGTLNELLWVLGIAIGSFLIHAIFESALTIQFYREPTLSLGQSIAYLFQTEILSALLAGTIAVALAISLLSVMEISWAVITALGVFVFIRGSFWLLRGLYIGLTDRAKNESIFNRCARSGSGQFGMIIFSVFFGTLLFLTFGAGIS